MARRLIGTAVTDSNGEATITYTGTGAGKLNVVAESGTFVSQPSTVIDATVLDRATSSDKNNNMWASGITGFTRDATDTLVQISEQRYTAQYDVGDGVKFEFECTEYSNGVMQIARYETGKTTTYHNVPFDVGICSIECLPNVSYFKVNGETVLTVNNSPNGSARFFFNLVGGATTNFRYKNLRIYPI